MDISKKSDGELQLHIKFITKQQLFAVPDVPFYVSQNIQTADLNKLLNDLLRESSGTEQFIEFDFIVLGQLLRLPLIEHLNSFNASIESTIDIEYIYRHPAPEPQCSLLHDEWVAGIEVADQWILTGCYDNSIQLWTTKGKHFLSAFEHTAAIKDVTWLNNKDPSAGFVSVSKDSIIILWKWTPNEKTCKPGVLLKGHQRGIECVVPSPNSEKIATGGWDNFLKIWSASYDTSDCYEPLTKRLKGIENVNMITRTPIHTLKGHKQCIVGTQWIEPNVICTASMDHTLKFWDVELCGIRNEIVAEKAFLGTSWSKLNGYVISCFADRHIRLYDPRSTEGSVCKQTFTGHSLWVSSVAWCETKDYLFMSGGYDHCVKIWDLRSPKASLYDLSGHEDQVLCVDWSNSKYLVSGGSDNNVHIFKNKDIC